MCPDGPKARLRISAAFPAKPLRPPVTCFRRKRIYSTITAIELHVPAAFAAAPAAKHVQEFHLIPLFRNKDACPIRSPNRVAHLPQKPDMVPYSILGSSLPAPRHINLAHCGTGLRKVLHFVKGFPQCHYTTSTIKSKRKPKIFLRLPLDRINEFASMLHGGFCFSV